MSCVVLDNFKEIGESKIDVAKELEYFRISGLNKKEIEKAEYKDLSLELHNKIHNVFDNIDGIQIYNRAVTLI